MVSKSDILGLEFKTIENYFAYIVLSQINGQYSQLDKLFKKLSKTQKKDFLQYLEDTDYNVVEGLDLKQLVIESL